MEESKLKKRQSFLKRFGPQRFFTTLDHRRSSTGSNEISTNNNKRKSSSSSNNRWIRIRRSATTDSYSPSSNDNHNYNDNDDSNQNQEESLFYISTSMNGNNDNNNSKYNHSPTSIISESLDIPNIIMTTKKKQKNHHVGVNKYKKKDVLNSKKSLQLGKKRQFSVNNHDDEINDDVDDDDSGTLISPITCNVTEDGNNTAYFSTNVDETHQEVKDQENKLYSLKCRDSDIETIQELSTEMEFISAAQSNDSTTINKYHDVDSHHDHDVNDEEGEIETCHSLPHLETESESFQSVRQEDSKDKDNQSNSFSTINEHRDIDSHHDHQDDSFQSPLSVKPEYTESVSPPLIIQNIQIDEYESINNSTFTDYLDVQSYLQDDEESFHSVNLIPKSPNTFLNRFATTNQNDSEYNVDKSMDEESNANLPLSENMSHRDLTLQHQQRGNCENIADDTRIVSDANPTLVSDIDDRPLTQSRHQKSIYVDVKRSNNTPGPVSEQSNLPYKLSAGYLVHITKGKYKGLQGTITKVTKQTVKVKINEETVTGNIPKASVVQIASSTNEQISEAPTLDQASDATPTPASDVNHVSATSRLLESIDCDEVHHSNADDAVIACGNVPYELSVGYLVHITKGKYKGLQGTITKVTKQTVKVKINEETITGNIPKASVVQITSSTNEQISEAPTLDQASDATPTPASDVNHVSAASRLLESIDCDEVHHLNADDAVIAYGKTNDQAPALLKPSEPSSLTSPVTNAQHAHDNPVHITLNVDDNARIIKERYNEKEGRITEVTTKTTQVNTTDEKVTVNILKLACNDGHKGTSSMAANCPEKSSSTFEEKKVLITGGKYKDQTGIIKKTCDKKVKIKLDSSSEEVYVKKLFVSIDGMPPFPNEACNDGHKGTSSVAANCPEKSASTLEEKEVLITGGKYKDQTGIIKKTCDKKVKLKLDTSSEEVYVKKLFVSIDGMPAFPNEACNDERRGRLTALNNINSKNGWRLPDSDKGGHRYGTRIVVKMRLQKKHSEDTFLQHFCENRIEILELPVNKEEALERFEPSFSIDGKKYELVSTKLMTDTTVAFCNFKQPLLKMVYVLVEGSGIQSVNLREQLEKIADFESLEPRKVVSRLELLQSPAHKFTGRKNMESKFAIFPRHPKDFGEVPDLGHEGCGFIDEAYLANLLGGGALGKNTVCLQIRAIIPSMGIFKGMLIKKQNISPPVQFVDSMKKVGASKYPDHQDKAFLVVCAAGIDPSKNNSTIARSLSKSRYEIPKSFVRKELSKMITRLLLGMNVPHSILVDYEKRRKKENKYFADTFLRGVIDPTDKLPPGHVFVTGVKDADMNDEILVTRSPCLKFDHMKVLKVVKKKPEAMTEETFNWLQSLPFGVLIFAFPSQGMKPIPQNIAGGDLDGDRYFVCWDKEILRYVRAESYKEVPIEIVEEKDVTMKTIKQDGLSNDMDWFQTSQEFMIENPVHEMGQLIGSLYKLCLDFSEKDKDQSIRNPDAEAFAEAYDQALEHGKHGTKIVLPQHLHKEVREHLRKYLITVPRN